MTETGGMLEPRPIPPWTARLIGVVSAAFALAIGELVSAFDPRGPSLVGAVGESFIDRFGAALKDLAVAIFGTAHKTALAIGIVVVVMALGTWLGTTAVRRGLVPAAMILVAAGAVGAVLAALDPLGSRLGAVLAAGAAVIAGMFALWILVTLASGARAVTRRAEAHHAGSPSSDEADDGTSPSTIDRRRLLIGIGVVAVGAGALGALGRSIRASRLATAVAQLVRLPAPRTRIAAPTGLDVTGLSPVVTPISDFFRIDTAFVVPRVDLADWTLRIDGLVERPITLDFDDLLAMDAVEVPITLACVSNEVGGDLVGTAVWQGVPLAVLLERAGPLPSAQQIVGRSVDAFSAGFPLSTALDGRTAIVAYAMNGEPLPRVHGFPARLVVAGLYGYVSATKWLSRLELATWDEVDGYWIGRGWSKEAPIKIAARIDVPRRDTTIAAGPTPVAGIALAPTAGVAAVEVSVDDGPWQRAQLGDASNGDLWVQWLWVWDATPGEHVLRVRAIDADGQVQTGDTAPPAPDGATGWHRRRVTVVGRTDTTAATATPR